ncbi:hypothetical protein K438DRAFT_1953210 [Mycena galopus ATCC 62051]|nr:hypothetical protein K438DRAFT_1953210 [Mycena galopus ATCC 62051]
MGIKGLWKILADAAETRNLLQYTVQEGFKNSGSECRPIIMGIDASIWMYQASHAITFSNAQPGPNPQLRLLFYRTAALLALPIRAVFVFDGPCKGNLSSARERGRLAGESEVTQLTVLDTGF